MNDAAPRADTLAWFECRAGAAGDMLLGALVDAGAPLDGVQEAVDALGAGPIRLATSLVRRNGLAATKLDVRVGGAQPPAPPTRTWPDVRRLIEDAALAEPVQARALDAFARLARAEAAAHRVQPDDVHFHEVGALDAIADVVGSCTAMHLLGIGDVVCTPVALGRGITRGAHGLIPVPGPAVLGLLREAGAPVYAGAAPYELCTPTGAALLAATADRWGELPSMRITAAGTGAGDRDLDEVPNVVRVVIGTAAKSHDEVGLREQLLVEANVDDLDPRLWPSVLDRLLAAGAVDAWLTPILMKKGRPAYTLAVLVDAELAPGVRRAIFTESSTIGLRERPVHKRELARAEGMVSIDGCRVRVKLAYLDGALVNAQPEYEDVAAAAATLDRPVKSVLVAAIAATPGRGSR